jgi:hypothetical protein
MQSDLVHPVLSLERSAYGMSLLNDRRRHARHEIRIEATAVAADGLSRLPLRLVNQSRSGAMLELEGANALPRQFVLLFEHRVEPCELVWQRGTLAGVHFVETVEI